MEGELQVIKTDIGQPKKGINKYIYLPKKVYGEDTKVVKRFSQKALQISPKQPLS